MDNVFIERLWKTVNYEELYWKLYQSISNAKGELAKFPDRFNTRRPYRGLNGRIPDEVYYETLLKVEQAV